MVLDVVVVEVVEVMVMVESGVMVVVVVPKTDVVLEMIDDKYEKSTKEKMNVEMLKVVDM